MQHALRRKKAQWKIGLWSSLKNAHSKLAKYYGITGDGNELEHLYSAAMLLTPYTRNTAFTGAAWKKDPKERISYRTKYKAALRARWEVYYKESTSAQGNQKTTDSAVDLVWDSIFNQDNPSQSSGLVGGEQDELDAYFESC